MAVIVAESRFWPRAPMSARMSPSSANPSRRAITDRPAAALSARSHPLQPRDDLTAEPFPGSGRQSAKSHPAVGAVPEVTRHNRRSPSVRPSLVLPDGAPHGIPLASAERVTRAALPVDAWCAYNDSWFATQVDRRFMAIGGALMSAGCVDVTRMAPVIGRSSSVQ